MTVVQAAYVRAAPARAAQAACGDAPVAHHPRWRVSRGGSAPCALAP